MMSIQPIKLDCSNLREQRQLLNNKLAEEWLVSKGQKSHKTHINIKSFNKLVDYLSIDKKDLFEKCIKDELYKKTIAFSIAILSSRQGSLDERYVLNACNKISSMVDINIVNLSSNQFRPKKSGEIINNKDYKKCSKGECLKSFDAKITGKITGWIFAKLCYNKGGHQDNVFEEAYTFCEWVIRHGKDKEYYIVLIDTNLNKQFDTIKNEFHKKNDKKLFIFNHYDFQKYLIQEFSK